MCTRIFWSNNPVAKVVSRTMDWEVSDEPRMWAVPAGTQRHAAGMSWTSRFGSVGLSMWDAGTVDGVNDRGLAAHLLYLDDAGYSLPRGVSDLANTHWAQWVLDNCATVGEAIAALTEMHVVSVPKRGAQLGCHLALEDAQGDSAIIEPIDGELVVHHGPQYSVMANSPTFDEQLANLDRFLPFSGATQVPGGIDSESRFVRASFFLHYLPEPATLSEAVAGVVHVANTVACPPGAPYPDFGVYPTWWISAVDLTNLSYYFWSRLSPAMIWVDLNTLDLSAGSPVRTLDPEGPDLVGDVTGLFASATLGY